MSEEVQFQLANDVLNNAVTAYANDLIDKEHLSKKMYNKKKRTLARGAKSFIKTIMREIWEEHEEEEGDDAGNSENQGGGYRRKTSRRRRGRGRRTMRAHRRR